MYAIEQKEEKQSSAAHNGTPTTSSKSYSRASIAQRIQGINELLFPHGSGKRDTSFLKQELHVSCKENREYISCHGLQVEEQIPPLEAQWKATDTDFVTLVS